MSLQPQSANPLQDAANRSAKTKRKDCYIARLTVKIPLDMTNGQSLVDAMDAVKKVGDHFPAGTVLEVTAGMGKI